MANSNSTSDGGGMKLIMIAFATVIIAAAAYVFFMNKSTNNQTVKTGEAGQLADNVLGKSDAPVTIIEYSSMTCPHCAAFHNQTLPDLKKKYIDTGKVKYILREFPLDNLAGAAFMLGRCLPKQDAYFEFIDMLYERQREWAFVQDRIGALKNFAKQAGFTDASFQKCLDDKALYAKILAVKNAGSAEFRIRSTPTFFVNGTRLEGAQPLSAFDKLIEPITK